MKIFKTYSTKFFISVFIILSSTLSVLSQPHPTASQRGRKAKSVPEFEANWNANAQSANSRGLEAQKLNTNVAKNVILFLGDGMGVSTITAGRIYAGQLKGQVGESYQLAFDKFPHVAHCKVHNVDSQVPDSAATATAFLCGEKSNIGVLGVNQKVSRGNCSTMSEANNITSILRWSLKGGKRAGLVTTTRITHATPAAAYAHAADRDWESDVDVPLFDRYQPLCEDIASQLITKNSDIHVIFGGGREQFLPSTVSDYEYPLLSGSRVDRRNLIDEWKANMIALGRSYAFVWNKAEFENINPETTDYILGLFDKSHMQYGTERSKDPAGEPTLAELTSLAIKSLRKSDNGYFLLVEGGRIDHALHENGAKTSLHELAEFDDAVQMAVDMTSEDDTLIVVTADQQGDSFRQLSHAGEDVSIFARGPMSHLFHGVQEQHYIAHAMAYASCVGQNKKHCETREIITSSATATKSSH